MLFLGTVVALATNVSIIYGIFTASSLGVALSWKLVCYSFLLLKIDPDEYFFAIAFGLGILIYSMISTNLYL